MKKVLKVILYLLYFVILFELGCRLIYSLPSLQSRLFDNDEGTWRRNWYKNHKDGSLYFKLDNHHPRLGWFSKPNHQEVIWYYNRTEIHTNNEGFRAKRNFPLQKHPDSTRIMLIGDSFTFGEGITDDSVFASILQRSMPHTQVINAGIHGYGHDQILLLLKEYGLKYKPDIIILGYVTEDMHRNLLGFRDYMKPVFKLRNKDLRLRNVQIPEPQKLLNRRFWYPRMFYLYYLVKHRSDVKSGKYIEDQHRITKKILEQMSHEADQISAKMIFAFIPQGEDTYNENLITADETFLRDLCNQESINASTFSVRPYFQEGIKNGIEYMNSGHFREPGHLTIANAMKNYLERQNLISN